MRIEFTLPRARRRALGRELPKIRDARLQKRYLMVIQLSNGLGPSEVARNLVCARSTVLRVRQRFLEEGEAGLIDRREENGEAKTDEAFGRELLDLVRSSPQESGWGRSTWTRELLALELERRTGVAVSVTTVGRGLARLQVAWRRPRAWVPSPWSRRRIARKIRYLRRLARRRPPDEGVFFGDEVDIHLNPRIGFQWMRRGRQARVRTPGNNEKRYVAGVLNPVTGTIEWVWAESKGVGLFLKLVRHLCWHYRRYRVIRLIVDNAKIHTCPRTQTFLKALGGRVRLHFLPPYCPQYNKIERLWKDLHDNVTRNHRCRDMEELERAVNDYLWAAIPYPGAKPSLRLAA